MFHTSTKQQWKSSEKLYEIICNLPEPGKPAVETGCNFWSACIADIGMLWLTFTSVSAFCTTTLSDKGTRATSCFTETTGMPAGWRVTVWILPPGEVAGGSRCCTWCIPVYERLPPGVCVINVVMGVLGNEGGWSTSVVTTAVWLVGLLGIAGYWRPWVGDAGADL